jgi:hypothetical protein
VPLPPARFKPNLQNLLLLLRSTCKSIFFDIKTRLSSNRNTHLDTPTEFEDRPKLRHDFLVHVMLKYSDLALTHDQDPLDPRKHQVGGRQGEEEQASSSVEPGEYRFSDID